MTNSFWVFPLTSDYDDADSDYAKKKKKTVQFRKELQGLLLVRLQDRVLRKCLVISFHPGAEKKE